MFTFFITCNYLIRYISSCANRYATFFCPECVKLSIYGIIKGWGCDFYCFDEIEFITIAKRGWSVAFDVWKIIKLWFLMANELNSVYSFILSSLQRLERGIEYCILEVDILRGLSWRLSRLDWSELSFEREECSGFRCIIKLFLRYLVYKKSLFGP